MWHDIIFEMHPFISVAMILCYGLLSSIVAYSVATFVGRRFGAKALPVPPYFVTSTTLLAIVFAFLAADIWSINREASAAARLEAESFQRLSDLSELPMVAQTDVSQVLETYAYAVSEIEWRGNANQFASPVALEAIADLRLMVAQMSESGMPQSVADELFGAIDQLSGARRTRIHIGIGHGDSYRWGLVAILAIFAHLAVAIVHGDRPLSAIVALSIFSPALSLSISIMAIYDNPYLGIATVSMPEFDAILLSNS